MLCEESRPQIGHIKSIRPSRATDIKRKTVSSEIYPVVRLSIVIPVLGNLKRLEDTLVSVLENRPARCQVVVVLNQPYDDPYDLKGEITFVQAAGGTGLVASLSEAIRAAEGTIVHLLTCGVEVSPGWADCALPHFDDPAVAAVAPVVLDRAAPAKILSAGLAYASSGAVRRVGAGEPVAQLGVGRPSPCGPDTLAAFYRRSVLQDVVRSASRVGDSVAGAEIMLALNHAGFRCAFEPACQTYADRGMVSEASMLRQGMEAERLFWRWAPARSWFRSLVGHVGLLALECLSSPVRPATVCRLAGRAWGALSVASHRAHWQSLRQAAPSAIGPAISPPHFAVSECRQPTHWS
jgi:hypothetical protein